MGHSCFKEDSEIVVKKVNYKYKQKDMLKGNVNSFMLFNDIYLFCLITTHHKKRPKYRLDLTFFDAKPSTSFFIAWKSLVAGVLLLLLAMIIPGDFDLPFSLAVDFSFLSAPLFSGLAGIGLLSFAYFKSYSRLVFRSYAGRAPLLVLSHRPLHRNYKKYINVLKKSIRHAQKKNGITLHDRLVGEMKDLRRLKDAGVLKEGIYNQAQAIILKNKHYQ